MAVIKCYHLYVSLLANIISILSLSSFMVISFVR